VNDVFSRIQCALSIPRDYWGEARRVIGTADSLDGLLPEFRALPDCLEAATLVAEGAAAWHALVGVVRKEHSDHRGYYYREDIVRAISRLGRVAEDGAYLYLHNFMKKVEHTGLWRKDASVGEWIRLPVGTGVAADLGGISRIAIDPLTAGG
jgi:hypothetical protein